MVCHASAGFLETTGWIGGNLRRAKYMNRIGGLEANIIQQAVVWASIKR